MFISVQQASAACCLFLQLFKYAIQVQHCIETMPILLLGMLWLPATVAVIHALVAWAGLGSHKCMQSCM